MNRWPAHDDRIYVSDIRNWGPVRQSAVKGWGTVEDRNDCLNAVAVRMDSDGQVRIVRRCRCYRTEKG